MNSDFDSLTLPPILNPHELFEFLKHYAITNNTGHEVYLHDSGRGHFLITMALEVPSNRSIKFIQIRISQHYNNIQLSLDTTRTESSNFAQTALQIINALDNINPLV